MRSRLLGALLLALFLVGGTAAAASAQGTSRSVDSPAFDVDIQLQPGGNLLVKETQQIAFHGGPFQKGTRQIALRGTEGVRDVQVAESGQAYWPGQGTPGTYAVSGPSSGGQGELLVEWWFPATTNQTRTFVVTYTVLGAMRVYDGGDQLRWNALPADRPYAIGHSTITLHLPADVPQGGWKLDAYPGQFTVAGSKSGSGSTATWQAANLPPNQPFEVRAQWPHGLVPGSPPSWQAAADAADQRRENLTPVVTWASGTATLVIGLGGLLWLVLAWYTRGRDVPVGSVPPELDERPSDLPPGLAGTLVDEGADVQDVVATVLDLARRGVIRISEVRDDSLAGSQRDFEVELLTEDRSHLRPFERRVLDTFFMNGERVRLSQLGGWFHQAVPVIRDALHEEVAREGLFAENPGAVRRRYRRIGVGVGIGGVVLAIVLAGAFGGYTGLAAWPGVALAIDGGLLWLMASRMPRRTAAGAMEAARWKAYARHLTKAQPDAIKRVNRLRELDTLSPDERRAEVFEETLPYAVAFGIERAWVQKFATVGTPAPRWLGTPGGPVVIGGPGWGGGWMGVPYGGGPWGPGARHRGAPPPVGANGAGSRPGGWNDSAQGGLNQSAGSLMDLLNRVGEVLSHGGGSDWSGGGAGGGWSGGGAGGSGGGGSSFS